MGGKRAVAAEPPHRPTQLGVGGLAEGGFDLLPTAWPALCPTPWWTERVPPEIGLLTNLQLLSCPGLVGGVRGGGGEELVSPAAGRRRGGVYSLCV